MKRATQEKGDQRRVVAVAAVGSQALEDGGLGQDHEGRH